MRQPLRRLERRFNLERYLQDVETVDHGDNISMHCPSCEKDDKLWILVKDKRDNDGVMRYAGSFICYYCYDMSGSGSGSGPLELIQWLEGKDFIEAIRILAENGDGVTESDFVETVKDALSDLDGERLEVTEKDLNTIDWPEHYEPIHAANAPAYLDERGISIKKAMRYQLGFCRRGFWRRRLIVPTFMYGKLVGFQARYMKKTPPLTTDPKTGERVRIKKVRFPKGTKTGRMLFNYDRARTRDRIVIVEDPFSAMRVGREAVATFGTSLSARQLELLLATEADEIVVLWDRDAKRKSYELANLLSEFWTVRVVDLPDARDVDEYESLAELRALIDDAPVINAARSFAGEATARLQEALDA